jgi:hypothetical protein
MNICQFRSVDNVEKCPIEVRDQELTLMPLDVLKTSIRPSGCAYNARRTACYLTLGLLFCLCPSQPVANLLPNLPANFALSIYMAKKYRRRQLPLCLKRRYA